MSFPPSLTFPLFTRCHANRACHPGALGRRFGRLQRNRPHQGIFLAPLEEQSSRLFEFVFQMFARGSASLPAAGMQAVPDQIAAAFQVWGGGVPVWRRASVAGGGAPTACV